VKIIFAGTPEFAANALSAVMTEHEVVAVFTQPDRPSGRGMRITASPVKELALKHGLHVFQPATLKNEELQQTMARMNADVMIVAAYGLILPKAVLQIPRYGCLNIHASLLPRWRGAAPIQRSILAGDTETGITIMQMDEGLDTGDMLLTMNCEIAPDDTAQTLHDKLADLGARGVLKVLRQLENGRLSPEQQDAQQASYAPKLSKMEAQINWEQDAAAIERAIRAYYPFPIAYTYFGETPVKILRASLADAGQAAPGTVMAVDSNQILVATGKGTVALELMQKPGGKVLPVAQFVQSLPIKAGDIFASK
jgi:methionyl-tRNA formyltransferase